MCFALFQQATMMFVVHDGLLADVLVHNLAEEAIGDDYDSNPFLLNAKAGVGIPTALDTFQDVHRDASLV